MEKSAESKKILLIAYQFCPKGQIGTRRWSKFAKYLTRKGYIVHVLCANYPYRDRINWCHDVENNPNIHIHRIKADYPTFLLQPKRTFFIKLFDRIFSHSLYYLDAAQRWGSRMKRKAVKLIHEENIRDVVVTGGPFTAMYHAAKVKRECPEIKLILDFRDPWSDWISNHTAWQRFRKKQAERMESVALSKADISLFTTSELKQDYADKYPDFSPTFRILYNGYDPDDFKGISFETPDNFALIYTGSLTKERALALVPFIQAVASSKNKIIREKLIVHFYGNDFQRPIFEDAQLQNLFDTKIKHCGVVGQKELFQKLAQYEFGFSINAPEHANLIGAKTFDYMGLGMKIMLISLDGELKDILKQSNQYVTGYSADEILKCLEKMAEDHQSNMEMIDQAAPDYSAFDIEHLTEELEAFLSN
ncbi:MAG: glycosyltransferase [Chitinophagales bacterium]|nr:glycosyltransferase [Chitinophagales bacterium]